MTERQQEAAQGRRGGQEPVRQERCPRRPSSKYESNSSSNNEATQSAAGAARLHAQSDAGERASASLRARRWRRWRRVSSQAELVRGVRVPSDADQLEGAHQRLLAARLRRARAGERAHAAADDHRPRRRSKVRVRRGRLRRQRHAHRVHRRLHRAHTRRQSALHSQVVDVPLPGKI